MEIALSHRFVVEVVGPDGVKIGDYPLPEVDLEPAVQWAHLQELRRRVSRRRGPLPAAPAPARVEPVPCIERGAPYIGGLCVWFAGQQGGCEVPRTLLHDDVVRGSGALIRQGLLRSGERFAYRVCAFPRNAAAPLADGFVLESAPRALEVPELAMPRQCSVLGAWNDADLPVVIAQRVLDEAASLAARAGDVETGGLLLGRLSRDPGAGELYLDIGALLTAPGSTGTQTSLRLGPETFAAVDRALALRNRGEDMVGWWHSHPHFCVKCPMEQRRRCPYAAPFFSQADRDVHRTLFPQAHSQALLITDLGHGRPAIDLFGWRAGLIEPRGFYAARAECPPSDQPSADPRHSAEENETT